MSVFVSARARLCAFLLGAVVVITMAVVPTTPSFAAEVVRDGRSAATAAASCWEIKQRFPNFPDGAYWLLTPQMSAPERFFCDQTMDGGGWVLIGRGREGWDSHARGEGKSTQLLTRDRKPSSFKPVQLPEKTINGLLNGAAIRDLPEGVRIFRAYDRRATSWQKVDLRLPKMTAFEWFFRSYHPITYRFENGAWHDNGMAYAAFGEDQAWRAVNISEKKANEVWQLGFAYGDQGISGSEDPNDYFWSRSGPAIPYAEVYLRPRVFSSAGFGRIPDQGVRSQVIAPPTVSDVASPTRWGVVGNLNGRTTEGNAPAQAFAQIGNTVYVGGNYTGVQMGRNGTPIPRTALAAFDSVSGELRQGFKATFNGQVKALLVMPDGNLLVGGDFTTVNGKRHVGTVKLNPSTGAIIPSWTLQVSNMRKNSGGAVSVRSLVRTRQHVYLGGNFTHIENNGVRAGARSAGRVSVSGAPDRAWNPGFNGGVLDIDVNEHDQRFYAAGYFGTSAGDRPAYRAAVLTTRAGAAPATDFVFKASVPPTIRAGYQQTIIDTGAMVFIGGSEHSFFGYDRRTMQRRSGTMTMYLGGDLQASASNGTVVYGGCHCWDRAYQDAYNWPEVAKEPFTAMTKAQGVIALDARTGKLQRWAPYGVTSSSGGGWGLFIASDGALWAGGDFTGSIASVNGREVRQWNGGWIRYPARDRTPPEAPAWLQGVRGKNSTVQLRWAHVSGANGYHILRDDRVVGVTTSTSITLPSAGQDRYFVRAFDAAGNIGVTTPVAKLTGTFTTPKRKAPVTRADDEAQSSDTQQSADTSQSADTAQSVQTLTHGFTPSPLPQREKRETTTSDFVPSTPHKRHSQGITPIERNKPKENTDDWSGYTQFPSAVTLPSSGVRTRARLSRGRRCA